MVALVDLIVKLPVLGIVEIVHYEVDELGESGCPCNPTFSLWHLIDVVHVVPYTHAVQDGLRAHTFLIIVVHILFQLVQLLIRDNLEELEKLNGILVE
jgi:hypothetical protein